MSQPWTDAEHAKLLTLLENGATVPQAAEQMKDRSYNSVREHLRNTPGRPARPAQRVSKPTINDILDLPPRPFAVPLARVARATDGKAVKAVVIGDTQVPFHDPAAMQIARGIISAVDPDILLHMGDHNDCWQISDYDRDPNREGSLQDDIDVAKEELHQLAQCAKKARRVLLEGNHEDRLRRLIWRLPGGAIELAKLRVFKQTMTWPYLLGLDEIGWEWIETDRQSRTPVLPKLISIHGHQLKGSTTVEGANARKAIQKYGRSCIVGHHHRACFLGRRDHNGQTFGIETGCLCLLDGQPYGSDFNWQQAVTVIDWTRDHRIMNVQSVMIRDGRALWRGQEFNAETLQPVEKKRRASK